jgi:hypothetical protein
MLLREPIAQWRRHAGARLMLTERGLWLSVPDCKGWRLLIPGCGLEQAEAFVEAMGGYVRERAVVYVRRAG